MQHRKVIWDYVLFCLFLSEAYTDGADKKERIRHLNMDRKEIIAFFFVLHVNEENYGEEQSFSLSS